MRKMKRLFAVILSLAMVLGMSLTALADDDKATIKVKDGEGVTLTGATLSYLQIIKPDQTTETGWAFASSAIEQKYLEGYNKDAERQLDAQEVIKDLIAARNTDGYANTDKIGRALSAVAAMEGFAAMSNPQTVTSAGVYAVKATQEGYTYNNMAAYVGFGTPESGTYPTLTDAELTAKRSEIKLDKSHDDADKVSAIGSIVTYTIKTNVPFIDPNKENKTYYIHDAIKGAEYYNLNEATVTLAGEKLDAELEENDPTVEGYEKSFVIDLCSLINDQNSNAGKEIVVTYKAKVTAVTVDNKAQAGHKTEDSYGGEFGEDEEDVYTGDITLHKTNEDEQPLANAGFEVTDEDNKVVYFTKDDDGKYSHVAANDIPADLKVALDNAAANKSVDRADLEKKSADGVTYVRQVFTKEDGTVFVQGLNVGTYKFTEKTAPEGYSINENPVTGTLKVTAESGVASDVLHQQESDTEMTLIDSKLSALPSTGGIGTTIFTIGGCAIMIIAAALFFASRRKSSAK